MVFTSNMYIHWLFINFLLLITNESLFLVCQDISSNGENLKRVLNTSVNTAGDPSKMNRIHEGQIEYKFLIKPNTIIRTGESRALGAKYLNETRLSSNHDCLMWCFETHSCNAAVYEEKNMQSCYLFDCGSPAKPLCKFTLHGYFTSSVLKISQHSYELSQWGRQVQLERGNTEHQGDISTTSPAPLNVSTVSTSPVHSTSIEQSKKKGSGCHHYQFQCVNNSECIAIYNVCDGIPQCPDGSDESSELKCPSRGVSAKEAPGSISDPLPNKTPIQNEELPVPHPSVAFTGLQNIQPYKKPPERNELQHKEDYKGTWPKSYSGSQMPKSGYHHHVDDSGGLGSPFVHKHSQFISANDPHLQSLNRWASDYDQYPSHSTSLEQQYNPYERIDDQYLSNPLPADYDTGKGFSGYHPDDIPYWPNQDTVQDNSYNVDEFPQSSVQNLNKVIGYPDKENAYAQQIARTAEQFPEAKLSIHKTIPNQNQPSDIDEYKLPRYPHSRQPQPYLALEDSLQQHFSSYPEMKTKGFNPVQNGDDSMYNNDDLIRASIVNQLPKKIDQIHHVHEQIDKDWHHHSTKESSVAESAATLKDNSHVTVKPTSHTKAIQRTVLDFKMSVAELYESSSTHAHEANSAILALVVGVTISFLLIVLLACRLKTLRRRMSRKGRALAHDADYLVNGMYL